MDAWDIGNTDKVEKTGVKTKISIFFLDDKKVGKVLQDEINPFPQNNIGRYERVKVKFGKSPFDGFTLVAWRYKYYIERKRSGHCTIPKLTKCYL